MVNFNSLSTSDSEPAPEPYHEGYGENDKRKKKKKTKQLAGAVLSGEKTSEKDDARSKEVAEKSKSIFDRLLKDEEHPEKSVEKTEPSEAAAEKTDTEKVLDSIPGEKTDTDGADLAKEEASMAEFRPELRDEELYGGEIVIEHEKPVVTATEATDELLKTVETTKTAEEAIERAEQEMAEAAEDATGDDSEAAGAPEASPLVTAEATEVDEEDNAGSQNGSVAASAALGGSTASAGTSGARGGWSAARSSGRAAGAAGGQSGAAGSGGGGSKPPGSGNAGGTSQNPNFPQRNPNNIPPITYAHNYNTPPVARGSQGGNVVAQTVATAAAAANSHEAYSRGRRRGLVTGLVVGGGIEHIRHKRREKRMDKQFAREKREQAKSNEKALDDIKWDRVREKEAEKSKADALAKFTNTERKVIAERPRIEITRSSEAHAAAERLAKQLDSKERLKVAKSEITVHGEQMPKLTKAQQIELDRQREQLELVQGHRIQRSAWHNIEVDEHGKAVRDGTLEYGHEYFRERAHEAGPNAKHDIDGAAGEVALVAAALSETEQETSEDRRKTPSHQESAVTEDRKTRSQRRHGPAGGVDHAGGSRGVSGGLSATAPEASETKSPARSLLRSVTSPPTTSGGTLAWTIALVFILIIFTIVIIRS